MKKLKALLADDEADALEILSSLLIDSEKVEVVECISDSLKIESAVHRHQPDVLFLDIDMPGINGLQLLENIREYNQQIPIVMVTAYHQYVSEAVKHNVFSYLSKPVDRQELYQLLDKLMQFEDQLDIRQTDKIKLPINEGYVYLLFDEIFMLEAEGNYTLISTINNEQFVSSYNMGRLFRRLPENLFYRINRGMVLNRHYIYKINKKQNTCYARVNGKEHYFDVSQSFLTQFNKLNK